MDLSGDISLSDIKGKIKRMKKRWRILWILVIIAFFLVVIGAIFQPSNFSIWFLGAFFEVSLPFSLYIYLDHARIASIEDHFPDFLRDIAEFKRSGVTIAKAIQNASFNDYGKLSPEVKKIAAELSWGITFEEAMGRITTRVESPMVDRAIGIITATQSAGGEVTIILETVSSDLRKLKELEKERKSKLSVYTMTIYAIYLLLLFIIVVLTESLVPAVPKMQAAGEFLGGSVGSISEFEFRELLFHVTLVEAFFAGIISGEMGEGRITAGIKHAIILVIISLLAFQLVPPQSIVEKIGENILDIPPVADISSRSIDGVAQVSESYTAQDIAEAVKLVAKERNRNQYKAFSADEVKFVQFLCTPCDEGKMKIESDKVTINEEVLIQFSMRYTGDYYEVAYSNANV